MNIEDKLLLRELQNRNRRVFEALFCDYYPLLTRFAEQMVASQEVAEDIVQNLFVHLWDQPDHLRAVVSLKSYLFRSVKNRCINHLRHLAIEDKHQLLYAEALLSLEQESAANDAVLVQEIARALAQLPTQMSLILRMKYRDGKKRHEIAQQLSISENTVKTQLTRGRAKLRKLLVESTHLHFFL